MNFDAMKVILQNITQVSKLKRMQTWKHPLRNKNPINLTIIIARRPDFLWYKSSKSGLWRSFTNTCDTVSGSNMWHQRMSFLVNSLTLRMKNISAFLFCRTFLSIFILKRLCIRDICSVVSCDECTLVFVVGIRDDKFNPILMFQSIFV